MQFSFIIPTKDRPEIVAQTIAHLLEAVRYFDAEIIIVNDSATTQIVNPDPSKIKIVRNSGKGVASARNHGVSIASAELIWFIDDDIWISKEMVEQAVKLNSENPTSIFNFNWVYPEYLLKQILQLPFGRFLDSIGFTTMKGWCRGTYWNDIYLFKTDNLAGATLLIPASIYKKVGGYDSSFPLAGFEDHDFSVRIKKLGITSYIEPRFVAYHNEVNKTSLRGFLKRTFNNSITRKHGVSIGYSDHVLKISFVKKIIYKLISPFQSLLLNLLDHWPSNQNFDPLYFRICNLLIGLNMYQGYTSKEQ